MLREVVRLCGSVATSIFPDFAADEEDVMEEMDLVVVDDAENLLKKAIKGDECLKFGKAITRKQR